MIIRDDSSAEWKSNTSIVAQTKTEFSPKL